MVRLVTAYTLSECMDAMGALVAEYEKAGDRNILFCEDRLTLIAERSLVKHTGGTFRSSVTTFARFLKTDGAVLGKQGSVMAVGRIISALQKEGRMKTFRSASAIAAQAKSAYETLAQFSASCVDADALFAAAEQLPPCALKNKLSDLALIAERYEGFLTESGRLDEAKYLALLPKAIEEKDWQDTNVFFLCFSSFTAQALRAVKKAVSRAKNVVGIFCGGKEEIYTNEGVRSFFEACGGEKKVRVEDMGLPLEGEAEALRGALFDPEYLSRPQYPTDNIRLYAAQDKTEEAKFVATQIKRCLAQKEGFRYRDVAVLLPSTDGYALAVKKAFDEYKIPYFIDEKKSLTGHPLCKFILSAFEVVSGDYAPAAVQALTGNYFFGEADEYRNYLLRFANFRRGAKRPIKEGVDGFDLEKVGAGQSRLHALISLIPKEGTGARYVHAVRALLETAHAKEGLDRLIEEMEDLSMRGYLSQFFDALDSLLEEAQLLAGDAVMKADDFASILRDGLAATEISLIPLKSDAVFVGDLCDSRIEKVRVLFAMGMTDEVPRAKTDEAFIGDGDIARLQEIKMQIDPTVRQVNARAKEAAALNLCTFLDDLYLTYPLSVGEDASATSDILRYVQGAFCHTDGSKLFVENSLRIEDTPYECSERLPALKRMLLDKRAFEANRLEDKRTYASLATALREMGLYGEEEQVSGEIDNAKQLFFHGEAISPTALETYFACPFKMFAERGLRLKERQETELLAVDTGSFVHAVLEAAVKGMDTCADEGAFLALAQAEGERLFADPRFALDDSNASNAYLQKTLLDESVAAAGVVYRQIKNSAFDQVQAEKDVRTETVRGKVDRVDSNDEDVRIVDYKTGTIDVTPVSYYVGKKLQMQLYMSALKGDKKPMGIFYFPTQRDFKKEGASYKLKGFINGDEASLRSADRDICAEKKSDYFDAKLGDNKTAAVMSGADFEAFLDYAPMVAAQARKEIAEGNVVANPYEGVCDYCKMRGACGYDCASQSVRKETGVDVKGIVDVVRKVKEGDSDAEV